MAAYKTLKGQLIKRLANDPTNPVEGQIWYNTNTGVLKGFPALLAWSSGGSLITAKYETAGFGTQTAAVMAAGCIPPANASTDVQEYNGTGFSTATAYPEKMRNGAGCGTETAGLVFGGRRDSAPSGSNAPLSLTAEYDGSSWTTGGSMGAGRYGLGAAGTQTAAVGFAGYIASNSPFVPPAGDSNRTEEYNGTAWTTGNTMGTARYRLAGNGTQTAALGAGGYVYPSTTNNTETEEYDGTNWSSGGALPEGKKGPRSWGAQTDAVLTGGSKPPSNTAITATINYDGSSWSSNPASLATGRMQMGASTGTSTDSAVISGGQNSGASAVLSVTEEYNRSVNVITGAAWAAGGSLNTARGLLASAGTTQSAMLGAGGYSPPAPSSNTWAIVEEYNGSTWSEVNNIPAIKSRFRGAGTQTAAATFGGFTPLGPNTNYNTTEKYDGTNWTTSGTMSTPRCYHAGFGTQTAAVAAAGATLNPDVGRNQVEEYDGSSWTSGNSMPTYQRNHFGVGTLTAGLTSGGKSGPSSSFPGIANTSLTFEYDGTNWTAGGTSLITGGSVAGGGTQTVAFFSGYPQAGGNQTLHYDGSNWVTSATLAEKHQAGSGGAPQAAGIMFADASDYNNKTEEFTGETSALNIKTITSST